MTKQHIAAQEAEVSVWLQKIAKAENAYRDYHKLLKDIRRYYRNEIRSDKQNIFWSSIETLKPFLYFKQPRPYVERKDKTADKVANLACRIMEKSLLWDLEQFDFDSVVKYARNDFLLGGEGLAVERYRPVFGQIEDMSGNRFEVKIDETVVTEYIDPVYFIADSDKVGIWEDCTWFAVRQYMTFAEVEANFGSETAALLSFDDNGKSKSVEVYEIWDKQTRRTLYVSKACPRQFLKVINDAFALSGFYPLPKPLLATCTNDSLIPVPDYIQIKPLLDELDGVTARMEKTMKALKISGCYDNAFPELGNILNKEVTLVAVSDFDRLKSAGGIKNIVDFMPIDQYIAALQALASRRQDLINAIYEVTGVSDIMRGSSKAGETATAVTQKTNFGTLRNQDRQNDMQRFIADLFRIKAEIICECFAEDKLLSFLPENERRTPEASAAVKLLKTDKLRGMVLGVESDVTFGEAARVEKNLEAVTTIHTMIGQAFDVVSKQPALLDVYRQMIGSVVSCLSNARQYENVLNGSFDKIAAELSAPDPQPAPQPNVQLISLEVQKQKNAWDYQIKKEQNELKKAELLLQRQQNENKNILAGKELEIEAAKP